MTAWYILFAQLGVTHQIPFPNYDYLVSPSHQLTWNLAGVLEIVFPLKGSPVRFHVNWWEGNIQSNHPKIERKMSGSPREGTKGPSRIYCGWTNTCTT